MPRNRRQPVRKAPVSASTGTAEIRDQIRRLRAVSGTYRSIAAAAGLAPAIVHELASGPSARHRRQLVRWRRAGRRPARLPRLQTDLRTRRWNWRCLPPTSSPRPNLEEPPREQRHAGYRVPLRSEATMALTIGDEAMSSDRTAHTAGREPGKEHRWEVSWLPGRHLDRNSAITAMVLADLTGPGDIRPGHHLWPHVEGWAAELGLTAPNVLAAVASPPGRTDPGKSAVPADPEAAG